MKRIRPMEAETCCICGQPFNKEKMKDFHPGKITKWMCPECYARGCRQVDGRKKAWKGHVKK